jgi:flagellar biosynthesis protein FlhG
MPDQADGLRRLVDQRSGSAIAADPAAPTMARSLLFTSGKGGVGTSNLALNLAIALSEYGQRVVLVDADLGLANIDLLCGLAPECDLGDVLLSNRPLADAIVSGPGEVRILTGAHGARALPEALAGAPERLIAEFAELEAETDFLLVDSGSGLGPSIAALAGAVDAAVVVATPEPTAMADAHAALQRLRRTTDRPTFRVLINQAGSVAEAAECLERLTASCRQFFGMVVTPLGHVRADPCVPRAVRLREPLLTRYPRAPAAKDVRRIARQLIEERRPRARRRGVFATLAARWPGR